MIKWSDSLLNLIQMEGYDSVENYILSNKSSFTPTEISILERCGVKMKEEEKERKERSSEEQLPVAMSS